MTQYSMGYNPAIAAARRQWDILHRKALKPTDSEVWSAYRKCHNKVTAMVWSSNKDYFLQLASNLKDSSKFWKILKYFSFL